MERSEPATNADAVRGELEVDESEYPSIDDDGVDARTQLDRWIYRAHRLVEDRASGIDDRLAYEVETLVAAHFAYPSLTGGTRGKRVTSVSEGQGNISFDTSDLGEGPGGHGSPFWSQAVMMEPQLETEDFWHERA